MRTPSLPIVAMAFLAGACAAQEGQAQPGQITAHSQGLHGYIGFSAARPPAQAEFSAGMGFYSAIWPLIDRPLAPAVGAEVELLALVYEDGPLLGARVVAPPPEPA